MQRPSFASLLLLGLAACPRHQVGQADAGSEPFSGSACRSTISAAPGNCQLATVAILPAPRTATTAVTIGGDLYVVGGQGPGGALATSIFGSTVAPGGALGAWRSAVLPEARPNAGVVAVGTAMYVFGGETSASPGASTDVFVAHRQADGTLSSFGKTLALPDTRTQMGIAASATHVYLVGGKKDLPTQEDALVTVASLDAEGNVTRYAPGTPLPQTRSRPSAVVVRDRLYVVGGYFEGNDRACGRDTVIFAPIAADGSLGAWTATTSFPKIPAGASLVASANRLYVIGGIASFGDTDRQVPVGSVLMAEAKDDGSLGGWTRVGFLRDQRYGQAAALVNDHLFVFGGLVEGVRVLDEGFAGTVLPDGSLHCP